jgi:hypothetical protein
MKKARLLTLSMLAVAACAVAAVLAGSGSV